MRRCSLDQGELYCTILSFYEDNKIFGGETTTRLLFLGRAGKDLRCVRLRHCWDDTPSYAQANLAIYDGITEETVDHDVITFSEEDIKRALMQTTDTAYYANLGHPVAVELVGNGETKVNAWLYYPSEEGQDFTALRPQIEEIYGIRFPRSLADWYCEGVPVSAYKDWLFPDWLDLSEENVAAIRKRMNEPKEWILRDVEMGLWRADWGKQPSDPDEAVARMRTLLDTMPPLIPICSHRYMICLEGNEDPPVISTVGYDTILYGRNLKEYLNIEFEGGLLPDETAVPWSFP